MKQPSQQQNGLSLIEVLITVSIAGFLIVGMQGLLSTALKAETSIRAKNKGLQQGYFAMQLMVKSVRMTRRLMIPLSENPNTAFSESDRDVLAVTLDPTLDRDKDGWADANNDKDYLDINNNGSRDDGEPERIDEDWPSNTTNNFSPGVVGIDDNGDGLVDNSAASTVQYDDDEDGVQGEDPINGIDDDNDGAVDEDSDEDMNSDGAPGIVGVDDDFDGNTDEGIPGDDDEDGVENEDWLDTVAFFLNGTTLWQRVPNIDPADGNDYQQNPVAENVTNFQVIRIPQAGGRTVLVDISLQIRSSDGDLLSFNTCVGVGSGL